MAAELHQTPRFASPALPLVDGTGRLWPAGAACDTAALREYTIHEQIVSPYRFATSLEVRPPNLTLTPTPTPTPTPTLTLTLTLTLTR